eukprot:4364643-Alexandrium_andersonii.AAC.1
MARRARSSTLAPTQSALRMPKAGGLPRPSCPFRCARLGSLSQGFVFARQRSSLWDVPANRAT